MPDPNDLQTPGEGDPIDNANGEPQGEPDGGQQPAAPATEFEIDGKKYTAEEIKNFAQKANDYDNLNSEFTRKSQRLAEYEQFGDPQALKKVVDQSKQNPEDPKTQEAKAILKSLGVVTKDDLQEFQQKLDTFIQSSQQQQEDASLQKISSDLSAKYDGKKGEPAFNLQEVAQAVQKNPGLAVYVNVQGQYLVDLEATYKRVHSKYFDALPGAPRPRVVRTERGGSAGAPGPVTPSKKEPVTEQEAIQETADWFKQHAASGE